MKITNAGWSNGASYISETSASVEAESLVFASGTRVLLRHVTSVSPQTRKTQLFTFGMIMVCAALGIMGVGLSHASLTAGVIAASILLIGILTILLGGEDLGVVITSSSGERWFIPQSTEDKAVIYAGSLQDQIFSAHSNSRKATDIKIQKNELHGSISIAEELEKLVKLKASGVITESEFKTLKAEAIRRSGGHAA